jgi:acyl-ACP thioesterase
MKHEFHSRVRYSECGQNGELTLGAVVNYFQDVSSFQGEAGGIGIEYLKKHHVAWILSAWQIIIDHYPRLAEPVTAQTWAYEFRSFFGSRNFTLLDGSGKMAAWANSIWVLYDTERQRPVRVPKEIIDIYGLSPRLEMDYADRKIPEPTDGILMEGFAVERHHLDTNHHVNNEQYIAMASEYLPDGFRIREMRCEYKKQALLGDRICPYVQTDDQKTVVALRNAGGESCAVVEFYPG